jgi:hypothetical protein
MAARTGAQRIKAAGGGKKAIATWRLLPKAEREAAKAGDKGGKNILNLMRYYQSTGKVGTLKTAKAKRIADRKSPYKPGVTQNHGDSSLAGRGVNRNISNHPTSTTAQISKQLARGKYDVSTNKGKGPVTIGAKLGASYGTKRARNATGSRLAAKAASVQRATK